MEKYMDDRIKFAAYLANYKSQLEQEAARLRQSAKNDEATLVKIRVNVVGILEQMLNVAAKNVGQGITNPTMLAAVGNLTNKAGQFHLGYLAICDSITRPWQQHLIEAREHGDVVNAVIEENKLETAGKLREAFVALTAEGSQSNG